ncbi:MAG: hypothetical protein AAFQ66_13190, partial [Pseudomonadota bacterium]
DGYMPGQTASLADGNLKVFVSRLIPPAGEVVVSISGELSTLVAGSGTMVQSAQEPCLLRVDNVSDNGALFSAECGDALPAPEGIKAGETAMLHDGELRVFASRIADGKARLAINGEQVTLAVGRSSPVEVGDARCRVGVDSVDRGHVSVSAICGDDVTVSDLVKPGSTILLADGATRVFVGAVGNDTVRFAVNGLTQNTGASGDSVAVDDTCAVTVEDVTNGAASFSFDCEG